MLDQSTRVIERCVSCKQAHQDALHGVLGRRRLDAVKVELGHVLPRTWIRQIIFPADVKELITTEEESYAFQTSESLMII